MKGKLEGRQVGRLTDGANLPHVHRRQLSSVANKEMKKKKKNIQVEKGDIAKEKVTVTEEEKLRSKTP